MLLSGGEISSKFFYLFLSTNVSLLKQVLLLLLCKKKKWWHIVWDAECLFGPRIQVVLELTVGTLRFLAP